MRKNHVVCVLAQDLMLLVLPYAYALNIRRALQKQKLQTHPEGHRRWLHPIFLCGYKIQLDTYLR